jgi:serine/threonine protein kinase
MSGFWNSLFSKELSTSAPMEVAHALHLDRHLKWSLDESVDPRAIFTKLKVVGKGGFGVVSQVVHRPSMKMLADKVVNPTFVDHSRRGRSRRRSN